MKSEGGMTRGPLVRTRAVVVGALVAALVGTAGCGSSEDPGGGSGSSRSVGDDAVASGVAKAKKVVADHMAVPTSIGPLEPLRSRPPAGKSIMYLDCGVPVCAIVGAGVKEAADALGWRYTRLVSGTAPDTIRRAWNQVVQQKPAAVISVATEKASFASQLAKVQAAGIPYVAEAVNDLPGQGGLTAVVSSHKDERQRGGWQADWIAADTGGKAKTVMFNVRAFPVLLLLQKEFEAEYKRVCPACALEVVNVGVTSIGTTLPSRVVSYLQQHPDTNYVSMAFADMVLGVPQALRAAGLHDKVKIVSQGGTPANFRNIARGDVEVANVPTPERMEGWYMVDAALRAIQKMPIPQDVYDSPPRNFLTKDNIDDPEKPYVAVDGFEDQFTKLWKLG